MYTQTSAELAESCSVKTAGDPNLPHTLESGPADAEAAEEPEPEAAVVEEPEPAETAEELKKAESEEVGAAEEPPQVQKSKSLLESLEEQMNNSNLDKSHLALIWFCCFDIGALGNVFLAMFDS